MSNIKYDEPSVKICAVWLFHDEADYTRIKLWSQILNCPEGLLKENIEKVNYFDNDKRGIKNNDTFLKLIYDEMKDRSVASMKSIFNSMRKQAD